MGGRIWTQEELDTLESLLGTYTVDSIARRLGRSFNAVNLKLNRMGFSGFEKSTDLINMNQLCIMLGVSDRTVKKRWMAERGLKSVRKGKFITFKQEVLENFLRDNQDLWNAAHVTDDSLLMRFDWYKDKRKTDTKIHFRWTSAEVRRLKALRHQGYYIREIAEMMNRSESSIKYKLYERNSKK